MARHFWEPSRFNRRCRASCARVGDVGSGFAFALPTESGLGKCNSGDDVWLQSPPSLYSSTICGLNGSGCCKSPVDVACPQSDGKEVSLPPPPPFLPPPPAKPSASATKVASPCTTALGGEPCSPPSPRKSPQKLSMLKASHVGPDPMESAPTLSRRLASIERVLSPMLLSPLASGQVPSPQCDEDRPRGGKCGVEGHKGLRPRPLWSGIPEVPNHCGEILRSTRCGEEEFVEWGVVSLAWANGGNGRVLLCARSIPAALQSVTESPITSSPLREERM
mmetsp:Transcript_4315/g.8874  ORF Transcript_4315/g.8874 Transcript_4315/m.8874 type:complete len:278 (+) Transcript_4315:66-899(+)